MIPRICWAGALFLFLWASCTKDKKLPEPVSTADTTSCDSTRVLYCNKIKPIIDQHCAVSGCHVTNFPNGDFTTYEGLKSKVDGPFFRHYVLVQKSMPPPPRPPLSTAELALIQEWVDDGAPEK